MVSSKTSGYYSAPPTLTLIGRIAHSTSTAKPQSTQSPSFLMSPPWSAPPTTPTLPCNSAQSPPIVYPQRLTQQLPPSPHYSHQQRAIGMFVSDQLDLIYDQLDRPMELQLFNGKPTTTGPITKTHSSSIVLNNGLWFSVSLLVTQLLETTPIVLGLLWLHNINPDINWRDLTIKFPRPGACLAAIHLCLQLTNDFSKAGATGTLTASLDDSGNPPPP
ncbi:hypothetical protein C0993_006953 [Termitomyces sp. T159_Od127]|nr:hypothetical protein C0993_006953 [Termitomyces sp. T159_Od127]